MVVTRSPHKPPIVAPEPLASGEQCPVLPQELLPQHLAFVMDGNGRWAQMRGLPRNEGHRAGEPALLEVVAGALDLGIRYVTVYAFSTENWRRPADEVRFLMNFNREVIRRRRVQLDAWGVRVRWAGRRNRLWKSVLKELQIAEDMTADNDTLTLTMCINYGGRAELTDAAEALARKVASGTLHPARITEQTLQEHMYTRDLPDVDLFVRSSGEHRLSNFLLWQSAYAELVFLNTLWPDVTRQTVWQVVEEFTRRNRRYGAVEG